MKELPLKWKFMCLSIAANIELINSDIDFKCYGKTTELIKKLVPEPIDILFKQSPVLVITLRKKNENE